MHVIQALTHTPSICFRARFALCFGDEIIMSGLALLFPNRPVSLHFIINDQIMENELGAWLFIIFFFSLFFYSKQQSYFIPDSRILWSKAGVFANLSDENSPIIFMLSFYCLKQTAKKYFQWMVSS